MRKGEEKYNPLSPFSVQSYLHVYVFSANHLGLENLLGVHTWRKCESPSLSSHLPPIALHPGVGPCLIASIHIGICTGVVLFR